MTESTALIALDWGTTSLRAYRVGLNGKVLQTRIVGAGIQKLPEDGFMGAFIAVAGDWVRTHSSAVLMASGMVGARQGWHEVPYVQAPATLAQLASGLAQINLGDARHLYLVPGISYQPTEGAPDVMRGEETQVFGALADTASADVIVLPGTHSKWVYMNGGRVERFATYLTGEVFELLATHSILAAMMSGATEDKQVFADGLGVGFESGGALLRNLFGTRAKALFDQLPEDSGRAYLSGLLIGTELADALRVLDDSVLAPPALSVMVIAEAALARTYAHALQLIGLEPSIGPADAAPAGMLRIAREANLL